ncbi:MAG: hypothetical protein ACI84C_002514 [Flavobacteriales bacterium]|jgi:hypothetical protein
MYRFYDGELNQFYSEELEENEVLPEAMTLIQTFKVGQTIYGLGHSTDDDNMVNEVYLLELDVDKFRFLPDFRTISTIAGDGYFKNFQNAFLDLEISPNESKVLISHKLPERDGFLSFRTITFDENLNLIEEHDLELEHKGAPFFPRGSSWTSYKKIPYTFGTTSSSPFEIDEKRTIYSYGHIKGDDENWFQYTEAYLHSPR